MSGTGTHRDACARPARARETPRTSLPIRAAGLAAGAAVLALGLAGCGGEVAIQAKPAPSATSSAKPQAPAKPLAGSPAASSAAPAVPASTVVAGGCAMPSGSAALRVTGMAQTSGTYTVTAYVETLECGPGVPDDVVYADSGSTRSFTLAGGATITTRGVDPVHQHTITATQLAELVAGEPAGSDLAWYRVCSVRLDAQGRITELDGLYIP
jgi:hypothetical protein